MKKFGLLLLILSASCAAAVTGSDQLTDGDHDTSGDSVQVNGPLRLAVRDFATQGGIFWALPSVTPGSGSIVVESTRYGSQCQLAVTGKADVGTNTIALRISFAERLTICTAELRALTYTAKVTAPPGTYDVAVIHANGTQADTIVKRTVVVR